MGRAFFAPEVVQTSAMDCGPAALKSMLEGFGVPISYGRLREACRTDVDGTSIDTIEDLAVSLGLDAEQTMVAVDHALVPDAGALPAIAVVRLPNGFTHFVVVWRRLGPFVQLMDPGSGRRWTTAAQLERELYVHTMTVPADGFREYAGGGAFLGGLRHHLHAIGAAPHAERLIARALSDASWRGIAALDASVRMVGALVRAGAVARGTVAAAVVERSFERAGADASAVPNEYWTARAHEEPDTVWLRGAVLVQARSMRGRSGDEGGAIGPMPRSVAAALAEEPERPLGRLWAILREDGLAAPTAVLACLAISALGVALEALAFRGAIDLADALRLPEQRMSLAIALVALAAFLLALQLPIHAATLRLGRHLESRFRLRFLRKIPRLGDRYFHSRLTSDMAQRAHVVHALRTFPAVAARLAASLFALGATAAGLVWLDPRTAPTVAAAVALSVGVPLGLARLARERDLRVQTHVGALSRFYLDALLGLVPLRAHAAERALRREHEGLLFEWERASHGFLRLAVATDAIVATNGVVLACWLLHDYLAGGGAVAGALLLVYWALRVPALGQDIAHAARQYPHLRNVALRALEPLGAPEEAEPASAAPMLERPAALALEHVTVLAGGRVVLDDVDLEIAAGARVAIVGASGAGKSTLVGLFLGWHAASSGVVRVDGETLDAARLQALRRRTAWVDPSVRLWNRTLARNLRYGNEQGSGSLAGVIEQAELVELLAQLDDGLQTVLGEGGALVSGGEGQRVRLGRALLRPDARLAILDEPFRGLDREARRRLLGAAFAGLPGATILCVTHDVAETRRFDRVLVVDGGRIVEDGAPEALLARAGSRYRALVEADRALAGTLWESARFRRIAMAAGSLGEDGAAREVGPALAAEERS
jgi:ATP-binding cassette subfamily B protein